MSLKGIDISYWQRSINLLAIDADFVIVKASEGIDWEDPSFEHLYNAAKTLKKRLGVYHFARPTSANDPIQEADSFYNIIKDRDVIGKAILALDWEAENQHNTAWAKQWLDRVYALTGVKPFIYMSESVTKLYDWSAIAAVYPLWVAKYRDKDLDYNYDMSNAGSAPEVDYWDSYIMWQWTSSGRLNGYDNNLDCDIFYGSSADWDALTVPTEYQPQEEEKEEFIPQPSINSYIPEISITPQQWYNLTIGKGYNVDGAYGNQCWDYFAYFVKYLKLDLNTYCAKTGYAGDLWLLKDQYGYSKHFDYITDTSKFQNGDWLIWPAGSSCPYSHIGMYWNGQVLGQNQSGTPYVTLKTLQLDVYGALRWKAWATVEESLPRPVDSIIHKVYTCEGLNVYVTKISKNQQVRGSVDGNKYGRPYDKTIPAGFSDKSLLQEGFVEASAQNGSTFYSWNGDTYAEGIEISMGTSNQESYLRTVSKFDSVMAIGFPYTGGIVFAPQEEILMNSKLYYGAITGVFGIIYNGQQNFMGADIDRNNAFYVSSGRSIIAEDDNYYYSICFIGNSNCSGLTGEQLYYLCTGISSTMKNAICLDGGGSVFQRAEGQYTINTERKVKNGVMLFVQGYKNPESTSNPLDAYSDEELADKVLNGEFGVGEERKQLLGDRYVTVQTIVNVRVINKVLRVGSRIQIRYGAIDLNTNTRYFDYVYSTIYVVREIGNDRVVFGTNSVIIGAITKADVVIR